MTAKRLSRNDIMKTGGLTGAAMETIDPPWSRLYKLSGAAAFLGGAIFLLALAAYMISPLPAGSFGWLAPFKDIWLIVIFRLHAGSIAAQPDPLYGLNLLDIVVLFLVGLMGLGLCAVTQRAGKTWAFLAAALPFLGIILYLATRLAGRCSLMGAGIVISMLMLRGTIFSKATALSGLAASALLLLGDTSLSFAHSGFLAALTVIGYALMTAWFFLVGHRLLSL